MYKITSVATISASTALFEQVTRPLFLRVVCKTLLLAVHPARTRTLVPIYLLLRFIQCYGKVRRHYELEQLTLFIVLS